MSRGLGWLQRTVLAILEADDRLMDTFEIAATAYSIQRDNNGNRWVTDAQHAAVRRALASLARQGKAIRLGRRYVDGRQRWANAHFGAIEKERLAAAIANLRRHRHHVP
jgi:hypothetical protein